MFSKFKELKDQILESSLTVGGQIADKVITKTNEIIETWGPVMWEQVSKITNKPEPETIPEEPVELPVKEPVVAAPEPAPAVEPVEEADLGDKLESISVTTLKKRFNRNQILKVLYIMLRSRQEWLSPKEIADFSINYKFKVLPGNVRKAINAKGIEDGLVVPRMRQNGRKNAKEYKVTSAGKAFVAESLGL